MAQKRKRNENRQYQESWEKDYFQVMVKDTVVCLICDTKFQSCKSSNIRRHYMTQHIDFHHLTGEERTYKISSLKKSLSIQQNCMNKSVQQPANIVKASLLVSNMIAKNMKSYSDGEFIKNCIASVIDVICPEKAKLFDTISLSRQTVVRRISLIANENMQLLAERIQQFKYFSLCLDESMDVSDSAQLVIFIRGVDVNFNITEELLNMKTLKDTTKGIDIFDAFWESFTKYDLDPAFLSGLATDGAKYMVGQNLGFIGCLKTKFVNLKLDFQQLYVFHCVIHQENLCAKTIKMPHIMTVVIKTINIIRSHGMVHRQFKEYCKELDIHYGDLIYFSNVRWLSRGKCLKRFLQLKNEIDLFMTLRNETVSELSDPNWLVDLCFLVDITSHLNDLNLRLQGDDKLIIDSCREITIFKLKLQLWEHQLVNEDASHFKEFNNFDLPCEKKYKEYAEIIHNIGKSFEKRFQEINTYGKNFEIFSSPFNVDVTTVPTPLQMEILDLQCNPELQTIFREIDKIDFYRKYITEERYPRLRNFAAKVVSAFGSTSLCESFFSKMKFCKTKHRSSMIDCNLENQLRIATTKIDVDLEELSKKIVQQTSH